MATSSNAQLYHLQVRPNPPHRLARRPRSWLTCAVRQDTLHDSQKTARQQARELKQEEQELVSAQDQLRDIVSQCEDASVDLRLFMAAESERSLSVAARHNAVDEQAPINRALAQIVDRHVTRLKVEMTQGRGNDEDGDGRIDEVPLEEQYVAVMFPELGEEVVVRITKAHTFDQLLDDACRYFGRASHRANMQLVNDRGAAWAQQLNVREEVAQMENAEGRIVLSYRVEKIKEEVLEPTVPAMRSITLSAVGAAQADDVASNFSDEENVQRVRARAEKEGKFKQKLALECVIFALYLVLFVAVLFLRRDLTQSFQMTKAVEHALQAEIDLDSGIRCTFDEITTLPQTWAWLQGPLKDTLFPTKPFYAGEQVNYSEVASHLVLGQLALVGAVRIKQWRVQPNVTCAPALPGFALPCFGMLKEGAEETMQFGLNVDGDDSLVGFSLAKENVTELDSAIQGDFFKYQSRAYVVDLATWPRAADTTESTPPPHERTAATLSAYQQNGWFDAATRAVSVMFTLYNGNTRILLAVQVLFEVSPAGRVLPTMAVQTFDRDPMLLTGANPDAHSKKQVAFYFSIGLYILFFVAVRKKATVIQELIHGSASLGSAAIKFAVSWHTVDMYVLVLFFISTMVRLATFTVFNSFDALPSEAKEYIDYFPLATYTQFAYNFDALVLLGATIKTAKYLQLFQQEHMVARVFSFAAADLGFVLILYVIIYSGFVIIAQQIFGSSLAEFRRPQYAFTELWSMSLGKMTRSQDLFDAAPLWAPLFLSSFIFLTFFLLANLFLAVLCNSFSINREQRDEELRQSRAANLVAAEQLKEWQPPTFQEQLFSKLDFIRSKTVAAGEAASTFLLTMLGVTAFAEAADSGERSDPPVNELASPGSPSSPGIPGSHGTEEQD